MAAQSQTPDGATTFLTHYVAVLNWSHQTANPTPLGAYEALECGPCRTTAAAISALAAKKQHLGSPPNSLGEIAAPANATTTPYVVPATLIQNATPIVDGSGANFGEVKASSQRVSYVLIWTGLGWQVTDIR